MILPAGVDRSTFVDGALSPNSFKETGRLVAVSNRVADLSAAQQSGGLAVAVGEALIASGGMWFGWSGEVSSDALNEKPHVHAFGDVQTVTVALTPEEHEGFYLGYSNRCLWPLLHYRLDLADLRSCAGTTYFDVNRRFAAELSPLLRNTDTIWVHDYHLIPLAAHLRQRQVNNPIGFFLHIPFPPAEIFAALPDHRALARTLFAYDLVGFQTVRDRENFARYAEEHLDCRRLDDGRLKGFGRMLSIDSFPIGIDAEAFHEAAQKHQSDPDLRALADAAEGQSLIVGVDRLDYSKGLPERIRGIEALLETWPDYRGRIRLLQVAPPTREGVEAYDAIRDELEQLTGRVNGRFAEFAWSPISYVHRSLERPLLAGLYRRCHVGLVTPLRDGMNLVAKEFVAAQDPADPGVLILSQFAGAAEQLEEALIVNPHDPMSIAAATREAIEMPLHERQARHRALWRNVVKEDVVWWRERFLRALRQACAVRQTTNAAPSRTQNPGGEDIWQEA